MRPPEHVPSAYPLGSGTPPVRGTENSDNFKFSARLEVWYYEIHSKESIDIYRIIVGIVVLLI